MNQVINDWPNYYPEGTPPSDAVDTKGLVFRLVDFTPPEPSDFQSTYEEAPKRKYHSNEEFILACGTSHYTNFEDIKSVRNLFPKLRKKMIASGNLSGNMGKMKQTLEGSHYTIWYKQAAFPHANFSVVE